MRVLVVEDDKELNNFIRTALKREGFSVDPASNGKEALLFAQTEEYDVILLDVMMPGLNGLAVLKELRKKGDPVAILMVTSQGGEHDKLAGLNSGADDYLVKPFLISELIARIRAVMRRRQATATDMAPTALRHGDVKMDLVKRIVEVRGKRVELTKKEFELLECFLRHPEEVLSKSVLESSVWGMEFAPDSNTVEVHVTHLREKLGPSKHPWISNVRGVGYRFDA